MTREFLARLKNEFPESDVGSRVGFMHWQFNFEQFAVGKKGVWGREPSLEEIGRIARSTLKRVKHIYILDSDLEVIQGLGKGDIVIIPGYQSFRTAHAIGITNRDIQNLRVFFSTSWHTSYWMTRGQIERYVGFAREYFNAFG